MLVHQRVSVVGAFWDFIIHAALSWGKPQIHRCQMLWAQRRFIDSMDHTIILSYKDLSVLSCFVMWVCLKMLCTTLNPMVLLIRQSLWKMAISLGILTQHFQTNPCLRALIHPKGRAAVKTLQWSIACHFSHRQLDMWRNLAEHRGALSPVPRGSSPFRQAKTAAWLTLGISSLLALWSFRCGLLMCLSITYHSLIAINK